MISEQLFWSIAGVVITVALVGFVCGYLCAQRRDRAEPSDHDAVPRPAPLQQRELRAALAVSDEEPWWRAVVQSIRQMRASAVGETLDAHNQRTPAMLHYYAGAAAHLDRLQEFLEAERATALKAEDED